MRYFVWFARSWHDKRKYSGFHCNQHCLASIQCVVALTSIPPCSAKGLVERLFHKHTNRKSFSRGMDKQVGSSLWHFGCRCCHGLQTKIATHCKQHGIPHRNFFVTGTRTERILTDGQQETEGRKPQQHRPKRKRLSKQQPVPWPAAMQTTLQVFLHHRHFSDKLLKVERMYGQEAAKTTNTGQRIDFRQEYENISFGGEYPADCIAFNSPQSYIKQVIIFLDNEYGTAVVPSILFACEVWSTLLSSPYYCFVCFMFPICRLDLCRPTHLHHLMCFAFNVYNRQLALSFPRQQSSSGFTWVETSNVDRKCMARQHSRQKTSAQSIPLAVRCNLSKENLFP